MRHIANQVEIPAGFHLLLLRAQRAEEGPSAVKTG